MRDNRQRIDARVENAKTAWLPDPLLAGMPMAHVFFPRNRNRLDCSVFQKFACTFDGCGFARMPCCIKRHALFLSETRQCLHFRNRSPRRLFQHHMLARFECRIGLVKAPLRRRAERNGINGNVRRQQVSNIVERWQTIETGVAAGNGGKMNAVYDFNGR